MDNINSVKQTLDWLSQHKYAIPVSLRAKSIRLKLIHSREIKQADDYLSIRNELWSVVYENIYDYLTHDDTVRTYQNRVKQSIVESYSSTGDIAYQDGGGSLPVDEETSTMITSEMNAQLAYVDGLFQTLKGLKKEGDFDANVEAADHADGYANSLDALYNGVKTMAAGSTMLTFDGDDGKESCTDCKRYKGQRHKASWWISHNAVPPNRSFECGGYHCDHFLIDDDGKEFTI